MNNSPQAKINNLYQFILSYKAANGGNTPTIRQMGQGINLKSTSDIKRHLDVLASKGLIALKSRQISVVGEQWLSPYQWYRLPKLPEIGITVFVAGVFEHEPCVTKAWLNFLNEWRMQTDGVLIDSEEFQVYAWAYEKRPTPPPLPESLLAADTEALQQTQEDLLPCPECVGHPAEISIEVDKMGGGGYWAVISCIIHNVDRDGKGATREQAQQAAAKAWNEASRNPQPLYDKIYGVIYSHLMIDTDKIRAITEEIVAALDGESSETAKPAINYSIEFYNHSGECKDRKGTAYGNYQKGDIIYHFDAIWEVKRTLICEDEGQIDVTFQARLTND